MPEEPEILSYLNNFLFFFSNFHGRAPSVSHPPDYSVHMKRNIQPFTAFTRPSNRAAASRRSGQCNAETAVSPETAVDTKAVESGLLGLCHEIAGLILRRQMKKNDAVAVRQEVRARLVEMMSCTEKRAEQLIDLSLELIHVKIHGRFQRNPLELSLLIARAGNQLREVGNN
jgi:hypothetical protein